MKIYKLCFDVDNFESLRLCESSTVDFFQQFDGTKLGNTWSTIEVERMEPDKKLKLGDAPGFVLPVFTRKATDILLPLIKDDIEVLPIRLGNISLYGINVLTVLDAIDYAKSDYVKFSDGKRILAFKKYAFRVDAVAGKHIFKIKDERRRYAFVSEEFVDAVNNNGLEGFRLEEVWDSTVI